MDDDTMTAAERAQCEAWEREQEEEYLRTASRDELIEELRELRKSRTELLVLGFGALSWLERNERFAALVLGTEALQAEAIGPSQYLEQVLQVADMGLKMLHMDRQVEKHVAENVPAVAAVMLANRRYDTRHSLSTWPAAARNFYLTNPLASAIANHVTGVVFKRPVHPETEYWAALMDVFPEEEFNVLGDHKRYEPIDGTHAKEEGYTAGYTSDQRESKVGVIWLENPYEAGTFLNAVWHRAYIDGELDRAKKKNESTFGHLLSKGLIEAGPEQP